MTPLFPVPTHRALAAEMAGQGVPVAGMKIDRFSNGELHVELEALPRENVAVLGAVAPPDENLLATLLLAHTLKCQGARHVSAVLPYLGYARHDRAEIRKSRATAWLGAVARASGIDAVVCVDVHSTLVHDLFPIPVRSLSPAPIFGGIAVDLVGRDAVVVAPDAGARERAEAVRRAAGISRAIVEITKTRTAAGVRHAALSGIVTAHAIVVDDILDTGGTLVAACDALRGAGAREITIMATHGLFTGTAWQRLWGLGVTRIYTTDTVPPPHDIATDPRVVVLPIAPLLARHVTDVPSWV